MNVTLDTLTGIDLEAAMRVGFEKADIDFSDYAQKQIEDGRKGFERLLASGNAGFVYGSTVAPGARAKTRLSSEKQEQLSISANAWAPKLFGGGSNWVPEQAVRLVLLARVAGYIGGHGRIRLKTAKWVASLLSKPIPKMPLDTATGPGEVMPLSWLYPQLSEIDLAGGELMSLYNGSPCATGFVTYAALTSSRRFRLVEKLAALTIEAAKAPLDAYDPALIDIIADPYHREVLQRLNEYLDGVSKVDRLSHQAPVSWRIIPTVLATAAKAVQYANETAEQSLQSVAHNPIYLPPTTDYPDGRAISPGGYHNQQASRAIDSLNAAVADICALTTKHTCRLLDGTPFGLPKLLVDEDSGIVGTEFLAWSQTGHAERARHAAAPAVLSIGLEDPGGGQSDVAAPVFLSFERYLESSEAVDASLATLAMVVVQVFRLSGRKPPERLSDFYQKIDELVAPVEMDRIGELGDSLRKVKASFSDAVINQGKLAALI